MRALTAALTLAFLITLSCTDETKTATNMSDLYTGTPPGSPEIQIKNPDSTQSRIEVTHDFLPIHGALNQKQIDQYYPGILDTLKDRRIIGAERIAIKANSDIYVSMLHNTGASDQMFLCTHDKEFKLLDKIYIGTGTGFDKASHTIECKIISDDKLEFHHVDWGYVKRNDEDEIDTLNYRRYILTISTTGKIVKE